MYVFLRYPEGARYFQAVEFSNDKVIRLSNSAVNDKTTVTKYISFSYLSKFHVCTEDFINTNWRKVASSQ